MATGIGVVAGGAADAGDQRAGPVLAGSRRQHQDRDVLVVLDQSEDLVRGVPSRTTRSGVMPAMPLARVAYLSSAALPPRAPPPS
jgi:hypothetical protein